MGKFNIYFRQKHFFLFLLCFCSSCVLVNFKQPQPIDTINEKMYPRALQGSFVSQDNDTITIGESSFKIGLQQSRDKLESYLSDTSVLRKDNNYFFLNLKNDSLWNIYVLKIQNDSTFSVLTIDASNVAKIERLTKITGVKVMTDGKDKIDGYIVNPTKPEFYNMIDDTLFEETIKCKRIK